MADKNDLGYGNEELSEDVVVLVDEEGNEIEFVFIDSLEVDGAEYVVLSPLEGNGEESDEAIILKVIQDDGEDVLLDIEDDEEWERVAEAWQKLIEIEE